MDLDFNVYWYGYNEWDIPDWIGTITFDDDDTVYGMAFFGEIWAIYESVELVIVLDDEGNLISQDFIGTNLLMWGYDYGVTVGANTKYHMNGDVQLDDLFGVYVGRHVHMSGAITYYTSGPWAGWPDFTYGGEFRVN